ncbi:hypothetical protein EDD18DRAFT_1144510 [Armillaria luteobubalina]|uniref:Uncharacterized protein n=1 Tax=Armillaria luteobubalina TaxID=153913 RepID=A0AA39USS7_9AGAR|nr:hypothetical protein EDD18DRAFT_1144510 [Armillaria luteobubalina]
MTTPTMAKKRPRPKGLWKARVTAPRCLVPDRKLLASPAANNDSDTDHDHDDFESVSVASSSNSSSTKRRRRSVSPASSSEYEYYEYQQQRQQQQEREQHEKKRESGWTRRTRIMDTTSTAFVGAQTEARKTCDFEDWMDLKDLFAKAAEQYEGGSAAEALPLLRGVVHECHRFLIFYQDPSVLFSAPKAVPGEGAAAQEKREWSPEKPTLRKCKCVELPTAFHAILGTALFLFGNLIAQDGSMALPGEPSTPTPYWLAALDVFETGENLPSRVNGTGCDAPEDWRMAIVWGRTLVCIADEAISSSSSSHSALDEDEPAWPPESPFSAIAARRPPVTRRMTLGSASPNDLMVLAMDQFSRGIFHMPHPQHAVPAAYSVKQQAPASEIQSLSLTTPLSTTPSMCCGGSAPAAAPCQHQHQNQQQHPPPPHKTFPEAFSRAKELYTIASEVLMLAEKLPRPDERQYWASWADSVFNQMKMEADMDAWRGPITRARGQCWLIVGSARADEIEDRVADGDVSILGSEEAEEAREGLGRAVGFFERARMVDGGEEDGELRKMLAEALVTLGNLEGDVRVREELYKKAVVESGEDLGLGDGMDVDS